MGEDRIYQIALGLIKGVGPANARKLTEYFGSVRSVFEAKKKDLLEIPGIRGETVNDIINKSYMVRAEQELKFIENNGIQLHFYTDPDYPNRLKNCSDAPLVLYSKGLMDMNARKVVGIVGTRRATEYGLSQCEKIVRDLAGHKVLIVSGLAYGIDICAHKTALKENLPTIACLGHSLDRIYPANHGSVANKMMSNGGLVSEFLSGTKPDACNFPSRNRIIVGMADVVIVVESNTKGGSLISAELGFSYDREIMAVPGRIGDKFSSGCNKLIKENKASMYTGIHDLENLMNWKEKRQAQQTSLFENLNPIETKIVAQFQKSGKMTVDNLAVTLDMHVSELLSVLLDLEFRSVVRSLPGKQFYLT